MTKTKKYLYSAGIGLLGLATGTALYVSTFQPTAHAVTAEAVAAIGQQTGMADCFWTQFFGADSGANYAYPDTGANYWFSEFKLPAGATLSFEGEFPYARHMSFNTYDEQGRPTDRLNDTMLVPEPGSTNPYLPGSPRNEKQRKYRMHLMASPIEAGTPMARIDESRPPNTLYAAPGDRPVQLVLRVYVPDRGMDAKGGVPFPQAQVQLADGSHLTGEALCKAMVSPHGSVPDIHLKLKSAQTLMALQSASAPHHPAQPVPDWIAFLNPPMTFGSILKGTSFEWVLSWLNKERKGGFYSTLDNTYMFSFVDNRYGQAVVLQGKAPSTPRTREGATVMTEGQLRYWSLCKYRSLYDTAVDACLYDEQVPLDKEGRYTIVMSAPEHRPANARAECGVAWLPWGVGDGMDNPHGGMLIYRHMLPAKDFKHSLFETRTPGDERQALGPYFPETRYVNQDAFEQRGCPAQ